VGINIMTFTHFVHTHPNAVKFAHQSFGNPKIPTLLKAMSKRFLKGCLNIFELLILKYLNLSPATAKGHMTRPCHDIKSKQTKAPKLKLIPIIPNAPQLPATQINPPVLPLFQEVQVNSGPGYGAITGPNLIGDNDNELIANVFLFWIVCRQK
jgi:hypothetical protein